MSGSGPVKLDSSNDNNIRNNVTDTRGRVNLGSGGNTDPDAEANRRAELWNKISMFTEVIQTLNASHIDMKDIEDMHTMLTDPNKRIQISDDKNKQREFIEKANAFLDAYNKRLLPDDDPLTPWTSLSLREIARKTIRTAIDIINDISNTVSIRETISGADYRRLIFSAFTLPERRVYVGIWLVFLSFILYFIDSAA
jgi:hypothetical protein